METAEPCCVNSDGHDWGPTEGHPLVVVPDSYGTLYDRVSGCVACRWYRITTARFGAGEPVAVRYADAGSDRWEDIFPNGHNVFYLGGDPDGFARQVRAECGLDPSCDGAFWRPQEVPPVHGFYVPPAKLAVVLGRGWPVDLEDGRNGLS